MLVPDAYRCAAVSALGAMGESATVFAPQIAEKLRDPKQYVRRRAVDVLVKAGLSGKGGAPSIGKLLKHEDEVVKKSAIDALGEIAESVTAHSPQIAHLLNDESFDVRRSAVRALGRMGESAHDFAPEIAEMLKEHKEIQVSAMAALVSMGESAKGVAPRVAGLLKDKDPGVRRSAIQVLGGMPESAGGYAPQIAEMLKDGYWEVKDAAVNALAAMGESSQDTVPQIAEMLDSQDRGFKLYGIRSLDAMNESKNFAPQIAKLIKDEDSDVREAARQSLLTSGPHNLDALVELLNQAIANTNHSADLRVLVFLLASDEKLFLLAADEKLCTAKTKELGSVEMEVAELLFYLANRHRAYRRKIPTKTRERTRLLHAFLVTWDATTDQHWNLQNDIAQRVSEIVISGGWTSTHTHLEVLEHWQTRLAQRERDFPAYAAAVTEQIAIIKQRDSIKIRVLSILGMVAAHLLCWVGLITMYPRSPIIQAVFFWNPWVRRIVGFGYVGLLLTLIPYLRRTLFAPFQESLLADASLDEFKGYFPDVNVKDGSTGRMMPIHEAIPTLNGRIVLEGASGLGKSMFVRDLVGRSSRVTVFLPAEKCSCGVMRAIQDKLHGPARDPEYLSTLIFSGAIDVCIDGLNEVDPNTRAEIRSFVEQNFYGNIILTTQPINWKLPAGSMQFTLLPLTEDAVEQFLLSRREHLPEHAKLRNEKFEQRCRGFLHQALHDEEPQDERELEAKRLVLSNPMDLTMVAEIIAEDEPPDLFHLQQQQFAVMDGEFQRTHKGSKFPLAGFSEEVYQMRLDGRREIPADRFGLELKFMQQYKMAVLRQETDMAGKTSIRWYFRHDKVMEFFIVQTFLHAADRQREHLEDARFRGVFFLLAMLLPLEDAMALRETLLEQSCKTNDTTVLLPYAELLNSRRSSE